MKTRKKRKISVKNNNIPKGNGGKWVVIIVVLSFLISVSMNSLSNALIPRADIITPLIILLILILIGVVFDIVGVATTTASETPFHSMASGRVKAAPQAIWLIRNADKVSNMCNDVIGDTVGIVSGAATAVIISKIVNSYSLDEVIISLLLTGLTASLTIGGKALGKGIAMSNANNIVYTAACVMHFFTSIGRRKKS